MPRETQAFIDQTPADTEASRLRLDQQQTKLGNRFRALRTEDRTDDLLVLLGNPAALAPRIIVLDESCDDPRDERFESFVPAVLLGVQKAMPADHPTHIARLMRPKKGRGPRSRPCAECLLDCTHCLEQLAQFARRQVPKLSGNLILRTRVKRGECPLPGPGEPQKALSPIGGRGLSMNQPAAPEATKNAAQIAGIEFQFPAKF